MNRIAAPAILFEPDGYLASGPKPMGRQVAGHGFLRGNCQPSGRRYGRTRLIKLRRGASMSLFAPMIPPRRPNGYVRIAPIFWVRSACSISRIPVWRPPRDSPEGGSRGP